MTTAFFTDERCFWHGGGNYAFTLPVGGLVQPLAGGLPENPETKRRLKNLIEVTGLIRDLDMQSADPPTGPTSPASTPKAICATSRRCPMQAAASLACARPSAAAGSRLRRCRRALPRPRSSRCSTGEARNAYALSRPPGHHCLPDFPERLLPAGQHRHRHRGGAGRRAARAASRWWTGTSTTATGPRRSSWPAPRC